MAKSFVPIEGLQIFRFEDKNHELFSKVHHVVVDNLRYCQEIYKENKISTQTVHSSFTFR